MQYIRRSVVLLCFCLLGAINPAYASARAGERQARQARKAKQGGQRRRRRRTTAAASKAAAGNRGQQRQQQRARAAISAERAATARSNRPNSSSSSNSRSNSASRINNGSSNNSSRLQQDQHAQQQQHSRPKPAATTAATNVPGKPGNNSNSGNNVPSSKQSPGNSSGDGYSRAAGRGIDSWQQSRAQRWDNDHRSWTQRGGYGGYYIPQDRFNLYFGSQHWFRMSNRPTMYMGYPRFSYGGFSFLLLDPWPEYWSENWYQADDVYVDYDDGYYLYNRRYPSVRLAITVVL